MFVDTSFWLAFLMLRDQYRGPALRWNAWLTERAHQRLTTELVLWELLNSLAVTPARTSAAAIYRGCQAGAGVELVRFDSEQLEKGLMLYEARKDKSWSLTDCLSFIVMRERGLTDALTADQHFQQAGFRALLLHEPPAQSP